MSPQNIRGKPTSNDSDSAERWECNCRTPGFLLGTFDRNGRINIKARDRYWHVEGVVWTVCPLCGTEHVLDLRKSLAVTPPAFASGRSES